MHIPIHENVQIQPDIEVHFLTYKDNSLLVTNHWHNSLEILLIKSGKMNAWVNDKEYLLVQGDFIIINSRDIHATKCLEPSVIQLLQIPYHFLELRIPDMEHIRFEPEQIADSTKKGEVSSQIHTLLSQLGEAYYESGPSHALKFSSILFQFLYLLVEECKTDTSSTVEIKNEINRKRLLIIINYVKSHYSEPISLQDAADLISLNQEYFCRFFKKNMGTTFLNYVNEVRMSHIYRDIMDTNETITYILEKHGFSNYKLFMKMFHEKYDCTPIKKRKQQREIANE
jgi:AraC-type DNA-binding domain-containing proteins